VGVLEGRLNGRPFAEEASLLGAVRTRTQQIMRLMKVPSGAIPVVAIGGDEATHIAAHLVSVILNQRGQAAAYAPTKPTSGAWLAVGDGEFAALGSTARISVLGGEGQTAIADLLDATRPLPWAAAKA
jgi:hypothetical protein